MIEYLEKDLKTETSSETKGSNDLTYDDFCMFVGRTCGEGQTVDIVTKEENGTARYFENVHTQLGKSFVFQHIGNRGDLTYDDGQNLEIQQSIGQLEEIEERTIKEFLKCIEDLKHQEDLLIQSSNETMGSYGFKTNKICVNVGIERDNSYDERVMNES